MGSAVAGVSTISDASVPLGAAMNAPVNDFMEVKDLGTSISDEEIPLKVNMKEIDTDDIDEGYTKIEDEDVARMGAEKSRVWWYWILIIIGLATGKTTYDKKNKRFVFVEKDDDKPQR